MNFDQLLAELGPILGFKDFTKTEDGDITASFDSIFVTFDYFDEHVYFLTKLADLPNDKLPAYTFLLEANSFGKMDGYIGIAAEQNALIFVSKIPEQLAHACYVAERLEKHINAAEKLISGLARLVEPEKAYASVMDDMVAASSFLKI